MNKKFSSRSGMNDTVRFAIAAGGIYICYFYYAIVQETIFKERYGDKPNDDGTKGERYRFALALVSIQCYLSWILARGFYCSSLRRIT